MLWPEHVIWGDVEEFSHSKSSSASVEVPLDGSSAVSPLRKVEDEATLQRIQLLRQRGAHQRGGRGEGDGIEFKDQSSEVSSIPPLPQQQTSTAAPNVETIWKDAEVPTQQDLLRSHASLRAARRQAADAPQEGGESPSSVEDQEEFISKLSQFCSVGSALHAQGNCRPCHFVHTPLGCDTGANCEFCHLPHCKTGRTRPSKMKRKQQQQFFMMAEEAKSMDPETLARAMNIARGDNVDLQNVLEECRALPAARSRGGASSQAAPEAKKTEGRPGKRVPCIMSL